MGSAITSNQDLIRKSQSVLLFLSQFVAIEERSLIVEKI